MKLHFHGQDYLGDYLFAEYYSKLANFKAQELRSRR